MSPVLVQALRKEQNLITYRHIILSKLLVDMYKILKINLVHQVPYSKLPTVLCYLFVLIYFLLKKNLFLTTKTSVNIIFKAHKKIPDIFLLFYKMMY